MKKYLPVLRKALLFDGMTDDEILSVLKCMEASVMQKEKDEMILHAGDSIEYMGILLSGKALIIKEDVWGRRNILTTLQPGDSFAEIFASAGSTLNIGVITIEKCKYLKLDVNHILATCPSACVYHTRLIRNLISVLAKKLLFFNEKITHMSKRTTREKLLSYLSSEAMRQSSMTFDIPYNRQQLADFLCVDRAAMSVELSKLQKEGIIVTRQKHFKLNEK